MTDLVGLVMAGGAGSRMAAKLPRYPKPLVRVGGMALVERLARQMVAAGVDELRVAIGPRGDEIRRHLEACALGVALDFLVETAPLGTIGALARCRDRAARILVGNGDLLSAVDLRALVAEHARRGSDLTIATHEETHRLQLGEVVADDDGRVRAYLEKPVKRWRISSGLYVVEPEVAALLAAAPGDERACGFPGLVERALAAGLRVAAHPHTAPWIDVNDEADLARAEALLDAHRADFDAVSAGAPARRAP